MSMDDIYKGVYALVTLGGGLIVAWVTAKMTRNTGKESNQITGQNNMLTQYQALVNEIQEERKEKTGELADVRREIDAIKTRERDREESRRHRDSVMRRYVSQLHRHIYDGNPPPPPPIPAELQD